MFASVTSAALVGVEPSPIRVEVHVSGRTRGFTIVGLPDAAVREARERVRSAIASSGHEFPARWVTVNLAPADVPKVGSAYDLPIALGVLAASGEVLHAVTDVDAAIADLRKEFAGLTISAAERVIKKSLDPAAHRDLIEEVLAQAPSGDGGN